MKKSILSIIFCMVISCSALSQSMPQIYGQPPFDFVGSELFAITIKTSQETIEKLVPDPLVPNPDNTMVLMIALQKVPRLSLEYNEMYIAIPSSVNNKSGNYFPLLYLDKAGPIVAGREIWGFPKFNGDFKIDKSEEEISVVLSRNKEVLLRASARLSGPNPHVDNLDENISFVVKEIPSADGNPTPAILRLNSCVSRKIKIYNIQNCYDLELELVASKNNFMPEIEVEEILHAVLMKVDFTMDYGNIEYDYLKHEKITKASNSN